MAVASHTISIPTTWFVGLVVAHALTIALTGTRITDKIFRLRKLWWDDGLVVVSNVLTVVILVILILCETTNPVKTMPFLYLAALNLYFVVTWLTRAGLVMLVARVYKGNVSTTTIYLRAIACAILFSIVGLAYSVGVDILYHQGKQRRSEAVGSWSMAFVLCFTIANFISDSYIIYLSWSLFYNSSLSIREKISVHSGFSITGGTSIANIVCWVLILTQQPQNLGFHVCLINAMSLVSVTASNAPIMTGLLHRKLFRIRDAVRVPSDVSRVVFNSSALRTRDSNEIVGLKALAVADL